MLILSISHLATFLFAFYVILDQVVEFIKSKPSAILSQFRFLFLDCSVSCSDIVSIWFMCSNSSDIIKYFI